MGARIIKDLSQIQPTTHGTVLYQLGNQSPTQMMGYVIASEGKLFVIDGGNHAEKDYLLALLRHLLGVGDDEQIHIDGWFLTHPHDDHVSPFIDCINDNENLQIDTVYYNFPSTEYQDRYEKIFSYTMHDFDAIREKISGFSRIVHTGDTFDFGSVKFDILSEPDESITVNTGNNSSVAIRMTAEGQTILFLGDMGVEEGQAFLTRWGDSVESDFCEMAHHGQNGVAMDVYGKIRPKACLWCTPDWLWTNNAGNGYGTGPFRTLVTRCYIDDLGVTRRHFREMDGTWEISLPYAF